MNNALNQLAIAYTGNRRHFRQTQQRAKALSVANGMTFGIVIKIDLGVNSLWEKASDASSPN